jgi:hypothetical protein
MAAESSALGRRCNCDDASAGEQRSESRRCIAPHSMRYVPIELENYVQEGLGNSWLIGVVSLITIGLASLSRNVLSLNVDRVSELTEA